MDEQDIQKTALYANYAKKIASIGQTGSKWAGSTTGQQAFGTMGKGASGLLAAYSAYRMAQGQGTLGDYANVGSTAASLTGVGKSVVPYAGAAIGLYNIIKNKEVNASDVVGLAPAALNASAAGASALGYGTTATAGAAGTGAAGGLGAAAGAAGIAALGYGAARIGGWAAGKMNDQWFEGKATPLENLEGSLSDPFSVENYYINKYGNEKSHVLLAEANPLEIGSWLEKGSLKGKVKGTLDPVGTMVNALSKSDKQSLASGGLSSLSQIGRSKEKTMSALGNIASGGVIDVVKGLFGHKKKSKNEQRNDIVKTYDSKMYKEGGGKDKMLQFNADNPYAAQILSQGRERMKGKKTEIPPINAFTEEELNTLKQLNFPLFGTKWESTGLPSWVKITQ